MVVVAFGEAIWGVIWSALPAVMGRTALGYSRDGGVDVGGGGDGAALVLVMAQCTNQHIPAIPQGPMSRKCPAPARSNLQHNLRGDQGII